MLENKKDPLHDGSFISYIMRFCICLVLGLFLDLFLFFGGGIVTAILQWQIYIIIPFTCAFLGMIYFDKLTGFYDFLHDKYYRTGLKREKAVLISASFLAIILGVASYLFLPELNILLHRKSFNHQEWVAGDAKERGKMVYDLMDSKILMGKKRDEIIHLLGPADSQDDVYIRYYIYVGKSVMYSSDKILIIEVQRQKVIRCVLIQ